jgi:signal transduction histidine kinase
MGIHNANMYNTIVAEMEHNSELLTRQRSEASKTQSILQSLSDGVLVCDTQGSVILSNPAASRILQWSLEELFLASNLHELLEQILDQRANSLPLKDLLEQPLDANRESRIFEMIVQVGVRDVQLTLNPVLNEFGELLGAMLLIRDVSREREYDRLRNEFISTMSHELRTPMTAIKGFTQLLAMGGLGPVNDSQREFLNTIQSNAERMISIINDVLDITKIETGTIELEWRSVHLAEILSSVVSDLQDLKKTREHNLHISIPLSLPLVRCDTNRLHQILQNLLSNAFKYTPQGGEVWVEAQEAVHEELPEKVRNCVRRGQNYVQMNIRDTGVGIAPEEVERVFERFYRTENPLKIEAGGTGLGLSLVKPLIELFGGFIWATSVPNEGSTFSFILPAV